jgi:hypothetical protein
MDRGIMRNLRWSAVMGVIALATVGCGEQGPGSPISVLPQALEAQRSDAVSWSLHPKTSCQCGTTLQGSFSGSDNAHLYQIPGRIGTPYVINLRGTYSSSAEAIVEIFDNIHNKLQTSTINSPDRQVRLQLSAAANTPYWIGIRSLQRQTSGAYTLSANCVESACQRDADCDHSSFCFFAQGCGKTAAGICKLRAGSCIKFNNPVCGCNNRTYPDECQAQDAGVSVHYAGTCDQKPLACESAGGICLKDYPNKCTGGIQGNPKQYSCATAKGNADICCLPGTTLSIGPSSDGNTSSIEARIKNLSSETIFIPGCSVFSWERKENGYWVYKGPDVNCIWEGKAQEIPPQGEYHDTLSQSESGIWRLVSTYGAECARNTPLSQANCKTNFTIYSPTFYVKMP